MDDDSDEYAGKSSFGLKIPVERVAVLIGKNGEIKHEIEKKLSCKLDIDSEEGDVQVFANDPINLLIGRDVVKAIGRGFNPLVALQLCKENYTLEVIELKEYSPHKNHQERLRGRVIGRDGRSRELIEEYTQCNISVAGKTVAIIGPAENVRIAFRAVSSLLEGSPHAYVYKWLERQRFTLQDKSFYEPVKKEPPKA